MTKKYNYDMTKEKMTQQLTDTLQNKYNVTLHNASETQIYKALSMIVVDILNSKRNNFINNVHSKRQKNVKV